MSSPTANGTAPLLTPKEVAVQLKLTHRVVLDLIAAGNFPETAVLGGEGRGARYRITQRDLDRFIASRRMRAA